MTQRLVAIDFSSRNVRIATVDSTLRRAQLVALNSLPLTEEMEPTEIVELVQAALPEDVNSVVIGCDGRTTSTRLMRFPFSDPRKLGAALAFELEGQLPLDMDEVVTCWHVVARTQSATEVLAAVMPRESLLEQLEVLSESGLEPRILMVPAAALWELLPRDAGEPVALLALGEQVSHLALSADGRPCFVRTLRVGGADIDRALAARFSIDLDEARRAKEEEVRLLPNGADAQDEDAKAASETVARALTPTVSQLVSTFKALAPEEMPKRLYVTGGLSRLPGLPEYLNERLGIHVELLDVRAALEPCECALDAVPPEYAVVAAMAVSALRNGGSTPLNFRRGEFAYQGDALLYRGQLVRIAMGLGIVILLAIASSIVRFAMLSSELEKFNQGFCQTTRKIVGREICDADQAIRVIRHASAGEGGTSVPPYSAVVLFEAMSKALPKEVDVSFVELDFRLDEKGGGEHHISGKGEAGSFEAADQVAMSLQRDPCFLAEVSNQRKTRSERVEFHLDVKVTCPAEVDKPGQVLKSTEPQPAPAEADPQEESSP